MRLHKIFSVFLIFVMIFALTACGKNDTTDATNFQQYHGEGQTQGGIKSDEEISALQEEERNGTAETTTEDGNNDQPSSSEGTPATSETGNADSYWQGNDYFDLIGYLTDNGYKGFNAYDSNYDHVDDNQPVSIYGCYSADFTWRLDIGQGFISVRYIGGSPSNPVDTPSYTGYTSEAGDQMIQIDNRGTQFTSKTLDTVFIIVQNIAADSSNMDPMRDTGINYSQQ